MSEPGWRPVVEQLGRALLEALPRWLSPSKSAGEPIPPTVPINASPTSPSRVIPSKSSEKWIPLNAELSTLAAPFLIEVEGCPEHPYWPGGNSGVTWGVGWDASQNTPADFERDWGSLPPASLQRLRPTLGKQNVGAVAQRLAASIRDVRIPRDASELALKRTMLPRFIQLTRTTFPGFDTLSTGAQIALISLVFNRGATLGDPIPVGAPKDRRWEMRAIRDAVAARNPKAIPELLRQMKRLWVGTTLEKGMNRRRDAEARMAESYPNSS